LDQLEADINIPLRRVIVEWTPCIAGEWNARVLTEVGIDEQQEDTGVEELGDEDAISN